MVALVRSPAPIEDGRPSGRGDGRHAAGDPGPPPGAGRAGGRHAADDEAELDDETVVTPPRQRTDESAAYRIVSRIGADRPARIVATRVSPERPEPGAEQEE